MTNFVPIKLKVESKIREYAILEIENANFEIPPEGQYTVDHKIPSPLIDEINLELAELGFPKVEYAKSYVRKQGNKQGIHIDGTHHIVHCAINIPLKGCNNSIHAYYDGDYTLVPKHQHGLYFYHIKWNSPPTITSAISLKEAHLVRVDKPHAAIASPLEDRWVFTMRFEGNPTFEDLVRKLNT